MTEITRVPLPPVARGVLTRLWLGIAAAALAAGGLAWATLPATVKVEVVKAGTGASPTAEDVVLIRYKGTLRDGKVFDQQDQAAFPVEGVIPGFTKALEQMQRGGRYRVFIPAALGYGDKPAGAIPANSDLMFEIELIDFRSRAEIEAQQRMLQQLQQMQQQGGGRAAPDGEPPLPEGVLPSGGKVPAGVHPGG